MPKPKDPSAYNPEYFTLYQVALKQGHTITGLSRNQATWLRQDLYSFRLAVRDQMPEIALEMNPIQISLKRYPDGDPATSYYLELRSVEDTDIAQAIAQSLTGIDLPEPELPEPPLEEEEPSSPHTREQEIDILNRVFGPRKGK